MPYSLQSVYPVCLWGQAKSRVLLLYMWCCTLSLLVIQLFHPNFLPMFMVELRQYVAVLQIIPWLLLKSKNSPPLAVTGIRYVSTHLQTNLSSPIQLNSVWISCTKMFFLFSQLIIVSDSYQQTKTPNPTGGHHDAVTLGPPVLVV